MIKFRLVCAGENALILYFGDSIDARLPAQISAISQALKTEFGATIISLTPAYTSLHIGYRLRVSERDFSQQITRYLQQHHFNAAQTESRLITIPTYYHPEVGLDLAQLLTQKHLSLAQFIQLHSTRAYLVYAVGFAPGFAFLASVNPKIQTPRLATPRIKIPAGSVGIAGNQTAIYPMNSAGGWRIVARTPLDLSLHNAPENLHKFSVGDRVRFAPIERAEFIKLGGKL